MTRLSDRLIDAAREGGLSGIDAVAAASAAIREMRDAKPGEKRTFYLGSVRIVLTKAKA